MNQSYNHNFYLALVHYPVVNKTGDIIASAVTNLDLHDMARAGKTYGIKKFYVITPLKDQKELVEKIVLHWTEGVGGERNPDRREALDIIKVCDTFQDVIDDVKMVENSVPKVVVTSARESERSISFSGFRGIIKDSSYVLTFGTAWGLSEEFINESDYILEPVKGNSDYNHLSVRSATSIILDRVLGLK